MHAAVADTRSYNPVRARNIPRELAQLQRERGYALTRADFKALGYTDKHLSDDNISRASEIYAREIERVAT